MDTSLYAPSPLPGGVGPSIRSENFCLGTYDENRFRTLDQHLYNWRAYWQLRPFHLFDYPWRRTHPGLTAWLEALSDADIQHLEHDGQALALALQAFFPCAKTLWRLAQIAPNASHPGNYSTSLTWQIPGRKWRQITAFASALNDHGLPFLEWCAGKGHLGRILADYYQRPVISAERNAELCEKGHILARRFKLPVQFRCCDILLDNDLPHRDLHTVALHACGELHLHLLRRVVAVGAKAVAVAPCCYHLIPEKHYQPLSSVAKASPLKLDRQDLQLPVQELVTGGARTARLREYEVHWRLGFDSLQRNLTGQDRYLTVPNVPRSILNSDFRTFCQWAAERRGLRLIANIDFARFEAIGRQRRFLVKRLNLVRHLFRQPLEIWLLMDRALFLTEHDYTVSLTTFCERSETPRHFLLQGWLD